MEVLEGGGEVGRPVEGGAGGDEVVGVCGLVCLGVGKVPLNALIFTELLAALLDHFFGDVDRVNGGGGVVVGKFGGE